MSKQYEAIVIGTSAGGLSALEEILPKLPEDYPVPIAVVQHLHYSQDDFWGSFLDEKCNLTVKMAEELEILQPGTVYLAPPNYHLLIEEDRSVSLSVDSKVNYVRPSIDVLFESAVDAFGSGLIGLILTGANSDGVNGLARIRDSGGLVLIQEPSTAEADYLPKAAFNKVGADYVLELQQIGPFLRDLLG